MTSDLNRNSGSSNVVESAHVQWKIAKIGEKQRRMANISTSYRKSLSLNPFSVRYLWPEVELIILAAQILSSQNSLKMVSRARNDRVFIGIHIWLQILTESSNMVKTANAQWKITKVDEKQRRTAKLFTSYRKSMSLNQSPSTDLRLEAELMHSLRMRRHYCHVWNRRHWTDSEFACTLSCSENALQRSR